MITLCHSLPPTCRRDDTRCWFSASSPHLRTWYAVPAGGPYSDRYCSLFRWLLWHRFWNIEAWLAISTPL